LSDATRLYVVFQFLSSSVSISAREGEGPHNTQTVTPETNSLVTRRNGT
jgi:hypothetical protein